MIRDIKNFFARIEWEKSPMMYGMEIKLHHGAQTYSFHIHKWTDLSWFYIHGRYSKQADLRVILGFVRRFYIPIQKPGQIGMFYYLIPIALWIHFCRISWRVWIFPLTILHRYGFAYIPPGELVSPFWLVYVRFRRLPRKGDKPSV